MRVNITLEAALRIVYTTVRTSYDMYDTTRQFYMPHPPSQS